MRVFILEPTKVDVSKARRFGDVKYIFGRGDTRPSIWSEEFAQTCLDILKENDYSPDDDALLMVGQIIPLTKLVAAVAEEYRYFRCLCWVATDHDYTIQDYGYDREG